MEEKYKKRVRIAHFRISPVDGNLYRYFKGVGWGRYFCDKPTEIIAHLGEGKCDSAGAFIKPSEKGGLTAVCVCLNVGGELHYYTARADCSAKDSFCYARGKEIALGRLRKKLVDAGLFDRVEWPI